MNITLSSDKETIEKTREFARQRGLSLNELLRRFMRSLTRTEDVDSVCEEFANTALTKLGQKPTVVLRQLTLLEHLTVVCPNPKMVRRAVELRVLLQLSFWDASIVAAAEHAGCRMLYSEELNDGQCFDAIQVTNPFRVE